MIETERLIIRPTTVDDAAFIAELMNTEKWLQFIGDRNIKTSEEASAFIEARIVPQLERLGFSCNTVIDKVTGEKLGTCGLYERPGLEIADIGFAFLPQHEGKGYGYESAIAVLKDAKTNHKLDKVCAITMEANVPSRRLLEKLGLKFDKMVSLTDDNEELMLYKN